MENSKEVPQKTEYRTIIWPINPTPGHIPGWSFHSKNTCTPMFMAVLFTLAKTWKPLKCPSTDEWIKKMWHIYTMEYYSAIKKLNDAICSNMDATRDSHTGWSKSEKGRQKPYDIPYMWNLKYGKRPYLQNRNRSWTWRADLWLPRGRGREWDGLGVCVNRSKQLPLEWMSSEILLYSTGNHIRPLMMEYDGG